MPPDYITDGNFIARWRASFASEYRPHDTWSMNVTGGNGQTVTQNVRVAQLRSDWERRVPDDFLRRDARNEDPSQIIRETLTYAQNGMHLDPRIDYAGTIQENLYNLGYSDRRSGPVDQAALTQLVRDHGTVPLGAPDLNQSLEGMAPIDVARLQYRIVAQGYAPAGTFAMDGVAGPATRRAIDGTGEIDQQRTQRREEAARTQQIDRVVAQLPAEERAGTRALFEQYPSLIPIWLGQDADQNNDGINNNANSARAVIMRTPPDQQGAMIETLARNPELVRAEWLLTLIPPDQRESVRQRVYNAGITQPLANGNISTIAAFGPNSTFNTMAMEQEFHAIYSNRVSNELAPEFAVFVLTTPVTMAGGAGITAVDEGGALIFGRAGVERGWLWNPVDQGLNNASDWLGLRDDQLRIQFRMGGDLSMGVAENLDNGAGFLVGGIGDIYNGAASISNRHFRTDIPTQEFWTSASLTGRFEIVTGGAYNIISGSGYENYTPTVEGMYQIGGVIGEFGPSLIIGGYYSIAARGQTISQLARNPISYVALDEAMMVRAPVTAVVAVPSMTYGPIAQGLNEEEAAIVETVNRAVENVVERTDDADSTSGETAQPLTATQRQEQVTQSILTVTSGSLLDIATRTESGIALNVRLNALNEGPTTLFSPAQLQTDFSPQVTMGVLNGVLDDTNWSAMSASEFERRFGHSRIELSNNAVEILRDIDTPNAAAFSADIWAVQTTLYITGSLSTLPDGTASGADIERYSYLLRGNVLRDTNWQALSEEAFEDLVGATRDDLFAGARDKMMDIPVQGSTSFSVDIWGVQQRLYMLGLIPDMPLPDGTASPQDMDQYRQVLGIADYTPDYLTTPDNTALTVTGRTKVDLGGAFDRNVPLANPAPAFVAPVGGQVLEGAMVPN